ncbi:helix-turn-helix domain-containing protein [Solidesulfovibrio magneticus]|uniref:helix-turn-helix domain-containing protein n=1 Tax=Solidesulfovibrio magneticus TaxID=184917 RepID=UPI000304A021|nr:helix-turn-helix domain-containing protein [Solidesulfovibrio magneticus]
MFDEAMERIRETTNLHTQVALALCLDIRQSSISDAKRRGAIPDAWLVVLYEKFGLNPTWIRTGAGPVYLTGDPDRKGPVQEPAFAPPPPEPTVTELKQALEARLGTGLRVVIVGAEDRVSTTPAAPANPARSEQIPEEENREEVSHG